MSHIADFSVYTILHPDRLSTIASRRAPTRLRETKRWVTAKRLFDAASARGETVVVLYADAAFDCSKLIYRGVIQSILVDATGTTYTVRDVVPLRGHRTQELVLLSTGDTIAEGYLRPYAVVRTPRFVGARSAKSSRAAANVTLFSFGYWGCGSATKALTDAVRAAEAARGFGPPLWVDIRIQRSVRAAGFRDDALGKLLGSEHRWMSSLGNVSVRDRKRGIRIHKPEAARELLQLALDDPTRRVIFFCACEKPEGCHRQAVAELVVAAARTASTEVTVVEWPGGEPSHFELDVPPLVVRRVARRQQKALPLAALMSAADAAQVAWGTTLVLKDADGRAVTVLAGPARFDARGAHLPLLEVVDADDETAPKRLRDDGAYGALRS